MKKFLLLITILFCLITLPFCAKSPFSNISGETVSGKIASFSTKARPGTLMLYIDKDKFHYFIMDENTQLFSENETAPQANLPEVLPDDFWGSPYISVTAGSRVDYHEGHWWNKHDWYHADKITILARENWPSS